MSITTEQGKTLKDAQGDVFRGLGQYVCSPHVVFTNHESERRLSSFPNGAFFHFFFLV